MMMVSMEDKIVSSQPLQAILAGGNEVEKETQIFQKCINAASAKLYQMMCDSRNIEHRNFMFFVPNLFASLSMLYAGAPERLKAVFEEAFAIGELKNEKWHAHFNAWSQKVQSHCALFSETVAAALKTDQQRPKFLQGQLVLTKLPLSDTFTKNLEYYAPECAVFQDPTEAKELTNAWVEKKTEGKIKGLVEEVPDELVLIMASAALFKGNWQYPFDSSKNSEEVFYNDDGTTATVTMMNKGIDNLKMAYDQGGGYHMAILELPFHGSISLLIMLPRFRRWEKDSSKNCAPQLKEYMTAGNLQSLLENYEKRFLEESGLSVGIPKVDFADKTDLLKEFRDNVLAKEILDADFVSMFKTRGCKMRTPQLVSEIKFAMNEEGAEVAAASYSPTFAESCDPAFKVCCPFGMAIVDMESRTIMGMGQVLKLDGKKDK